MTPEAQRIAIAEFCGWAWDVNGSKEVYWINKEKPFLSFRSPPDYLNDLNAIHEAEERLIADAHRGADYDFTVQLENVVGYNTFQKHHATASQRAEALLRTIGKWGDSK